MVFFIKKQLLLYLCNYLSLLVFNINLQIVHLLTSSLFFLGIKIKSVEYMRSILLICPLSFLLYNFKILGFLKYFNGRLLPCAQRKWLSLSSADIF